MTVIPDAPVTATAPPVSSRRPVIVRLMRDPQGALRLLPAGGNRGIGMLDFGQHPRAALVIARPLVGQVEAARGAVDEPNAEPRLQARQPPADHGRRQAQFPRRRREAAGGDDLGEDRHLVERISHLCILCKSVLTGTPGLAIGVKG